MNKNRLEAFSDAFIAIILTIMVLELHIPTGTTLTALLPLLPLFLGYVLSFLYLGIYWNNHHHMLHATDHVDGRVLWANLHLLFWLSLVPFVTGWMAESGFAQLPIILYGVDLLFSAIAYFILQTTILAHCDANHDLRRAVGNDWKGKGSIILYILSLGLAFAHPLFALGGYVLVALLWLVPDSRIEKTAGHRNTKHHH